MRTRTLVSIGGASVVVFAVVLLGWSLRKPKALVSTDRRVDSIASSAPRAAESAPGDTLSEPQREERAKARRTRDAMREDILRAVRKRAADQAASPKPTSEIVAKRDSKPSSDEDDVPVGNYEPDYIRSHFREDMFPLLKSCYGSALKRQPDLAGKLALRFTIVGDPKVGGVIDTADFADESDLKDAEMETCVRESLMTLTFDKQPSGSGKVSVVYPIEFSPDPDPDEKAPAKK